MEGAAQLVSIVGQLVGGEYRQLRGVGAQVTELSDELATMNAILRMHSDAEEGAADHFIREWVRQVSELAYDAEDCVHLYIFRIRCRPRDRFYAWSKRMVATLFPRRRLAREIRALQARAVVISERHARYGVSRPPPSSAHVPAVATSAHALRHANANVAHQFVGIKEQAEIHAKKLKVMSDNEFVTEQLQVFSIVGFGGLGKTTLAMEMCRQLEADFQRQAQVSVSQMFDGGKDLKGLLIRVLRQIVKPKVVIEEDVKAKVEDPLHGIENMHLHDLAEKLKELLKDTRYV